MACELFLLLASRSLDSCLQSSYSGLTIGGNVFLPLIKLHRVKFGRHAWDGCVCDCQGIVYAPINVNPVGGGVRARGGDLTAKSIPSVGGLIEHFCSGVGTFDFLDRETGTKIKRGYMASSFLALESPAVS